MLKEHNVNLFLLLGPKIADILYHVDKQLNLCEVAPQVSMILKDKIEMYMHKDLDIV